MDLIFFIFLSSNQEPGERLFVGLIIGALTGFVMWLLGRKWKKQENKEFQENKAEAFVNSDSKGSGDYYEYLYSDLIEKCHPKNFMEPYDFEKVKVANELYPKLLACDKKDNSNLLAIRNEAINKLGIKMTTQFIFDAVSKMCNPQQFMNPYNPDKVAIANELYSRAQRNKNNIIELELIRDEAVQRLNAEVKDNKTNYTNNVVQNQEDDKNINTTFYFVFFIVIIFSILLVILSSRLGF